MNHDDRPVLLLTCAGISHAGQLTALAGHSLHCRHPVLVTRHLKLTTLKSALEKEFEDEEYVIAVDGCEKRCAKKRIDLIGKVPDAYIIATSEGITRRGMEEPRFDEIESLSQAIIRIIRNETRAENKGDIR